MPIASWRRLGTVAMPSDQGWEDVLDELERRVPDAIHSLTILERDGALRVLGHVRSETALEALIALVVGKAPHLDIAFEIEVTGVFRSANRRDPFDAIFSDGMEDSIALQYDIGVAAPSSDEILLHPSIRMEDEAVVGIRVRILVDLQVEPDDGTEGDVVALSDLPEDWSELQVDVELRSSELVFDTSVGSAVVGRGVVHVRRGRRSLPAVFDAMVSQSAAANQEIAVVAIFTFRGRHAGTASRTFPLADSFSLDALGSIAGRNLLAPSASRSATVSIVPRAQPPELTIHILADKKREGDLIWSFMAPNAMGIGPKERDDRIDLGPTAKAFADRVLTDCPRTPPERAQRVLRGIGEQIWDAAPAKFRELYLAMRETHGSNFPIQIVTDEPYVPWEMMRPTGQDARNDHLYLTHPLSRWTLADAGRMPNSFAGNAIESFVPDYGPDKVLPEALEEGQWLVDRLGATAHPPTYKSFMALLECTAETRDVLLVHFAGHGRTAGGGEPPRLMLQDGNVTLPEIRQSGVTLGGRDGCFFVLNACAMAQTKPELGVTEGWAGALIGNGFGGVLAPLWEVQDEVASRTVRSFLQAFVGENATLGAAMLAARREHHAGSTTPFAYICHGDVMARASGIRTASTVTW